MLHCHSADGLDCLAYLTSSSFRTRFLLFSQEKSLIGSSSNVHSWFRLFSSLLLHLSVFLTILKKLLQKKKKKVLRKIPLRSAWTTPLSWRPRKTWLLTSLFQFPRSSASGLLSSCPPLAPQPHLTSVSLAYFTARSGSLGSFQTLCYLRSQHMLPSLNLEWSTPCSSIATSISSPKSHHNTPSSKMLVWLLPTYISNSLSSVSQIFSFFQLAFHTTCNYTFICAMVY